MKVDAWRAAVWLWVSAPLCAVLPFLGLGRWLGILLSGTAAWLYLQRSDPARRARVVGTLLGWAFLLSATWIVLTIRFPDLASESIPGSADYWREMRPFVLEGVGRETEPARFVPQHLGHLVAFIVLAVLSRGWAGLMLGAYLVGTMSYYVGMVALTMVHPWIGALLAWHPWAVIRVVAFVTLGVSAAQLWPARQHLTRYWEQERRFIVTGLALWGADLVLKATLAVPWSGLIRRLAG